MVNSGSGNVGAEHYFDAGNNSNKKEELFQDVAMYTI
jgi:hypothetical protein